VPVGARLIKINIRSRIADPNHSGIVGDYVHNSHAVSRVSSLQLLAKHCCSESQRNFLGLVTGPHQSANDSQSNLGFSR
jgi:hypothetical protein